MTAMADLLSLPGGDTLVGWFQRVHHFHDANLLEMAFPAKGSGLLRIHTWQMTDRLDEQKYFILEKHALVTFHLEGVKEVNCLDIDMTPAIIGSLQISRTGELVSIEWDSSYGVYGAIRASRASISLRPGEPV